MESLKIKMGGKEIPYLSYQIMESFNNVVSTIEVETMFDFMDNLIDINGNEFYPVQVVATNQGSCKTLFYPKNYIDWSKKLYQPVNKDMTFEELMSFYGISTCIHQKSATVSWCLPETKFKELFKLVRDSVKIPNGGGVLMTVGFNGKLRVVDLKKTLDSDEGMAFVGNYKLITRDITWNNEVPLSIDLTKSSIEQEVFNERFELVKNSSVGVMTEVCFSERAINNSSIRINNKQWRKLCTSKVYHIEDASVPDELYLGQVLKNEKTKDTMMVYQYTITGTNEIQRLEILGVNRP